MARFLARLGVSLVLYVICGAIVLGVLWLINVTLTPMLFAVLFFTLSVGSNLATALAFDKFVPRRQRQ